MDGVERRAYLKPREELLVTITCHICMIPLCTFPSAQWVHQRVCCSIQHAAPVQ